ncbi:MAG: FAD-dependent oxidoreductase [Nitrospinales bacterium]
MHELKPFDIAIVGGGRAGVAAALRAAERGARVCLVEKDRLGGAGLQSGLACLGVVMDSLGLTRGVRPPSPGETGPSPQPSLDIPLLFDKVRGAARALSEERQRSLQAKGVVLLKGTGTLLDATHLTVATTDGGNESVEAKSIILATGSQTDALPAMPFDDRDIISSDDILKSADIPQSVMVVGGGGAACETATLLNRLGSRVFLCVPRARLLPEADPDVAAMLEKALKNRKIKLLLHKKPESFYKNNDKMEICLEGGIKFSVHKIVAAGEMRKPHSETLGANSPKIRLGEQGEVLVNEKMETSVSGLYAIGGITGRAPSPVLSSEEAKVAVGNALGTPKSLDRGKMPFIVYSEPELAGVGCLAGEAHHKGYRAVEGCADRLDRPVVTGGDAEFFKIVVDRSTRKVIGGHILAHRASEKIVPVWLAVQKGLTAADLAGLPHGTASQGIREAARTALRALKTGR